MVKGFQFQKSRPREIQLAPFLLCKIQDPKALTRIVQPDSKLKNQNDSKSSGIAFANYEPTTL